MNSTLGAYLRFCPLLLVEAEKQKLRKLGVWEAGRDSCGGLLHQLPCGVSRPTLHPTAQKSLEVPAEAWDHVFLMVGMQEMYLLKVPQCVWLG